MIFRVTSEPEAHCVCCDCSDTQACAPKWCRWERVDRELRLGVCSNCTKLLPRWDTAMAAYKKAGRKGDFMALLNERAS